METIEKLKEKELEYKNALAEIKEKLDAVAELEILPGLKERYEGKYFKYLNSLGDFTFFSMSYVFFRGLM